MTLQIIDWIGIFVFALSGGLVAVRQRMDLLGVIVIALLPAIGGGTLRDLLLDQPIFWLRNEETLLLAMAAGVAAFLSPRFWSRMKSLVWIDAMGLALFAVVGASKAYSLDYGPVVCVAMGGITATAGGLLRDIVCGQIPMLLREDIYATAAISGASIYWICKFVSINETVSLLIGASMVMLIRALGIKLNLGLPKPSSMNDDFN